MKELPLSERPHEKVLENGSASLSDAELLAVILRSGARGVPAKELAEEVLALGSPAGLLGLFHGSLQDFMEIRGVGQVKAIQLAASGSFQADLEGGGSGGNAPVRPSGPGGRPLYGRDAPHGAGEPKALDLKHEKSLDPRGGYFQRNRQRFSVNSKRAVYRGSAVPRSGDHPASTTIERDPTPSKEDCLYTRTDQQAGNLLGIPLLDHIIIGDNSM